MPTALITGVAGQDGALLSELLRAKSYRVVGLVQAESQPTSQVATYLHDVDLLTGDLRDSGSLRDALEAAQPDEIYNLAGISSVAHSWREPELTAEVNALGALRLVQEVMSYGDQAGRRPRLVQASSAEMFGLPEEVPQNETTPLRPRNPYAVSKAFAHEIMGSYRAAGRLYASSVILYNHESHLRPVTFVTRKISRRVAEIALGRADALVLGDLDIHRDWGFAGDYVHAMWLALQPDTAADYVVATGVSHSIRQFVAAAFHSVGITDWTRRVRSDPALLRPTDAPMLVGDATKARSILGWRPTVDFTTLVESMVQWDLADLSSPALPPSAP